MNNRIIMSRKNKGLISSLSLAAILGMSCSAFAKNGTQVSGVSEVSNQAAAIESQSSSSIDQIIPEIDVTGFKPIPKINLSQLQKHETKQNLTDEKFDYAKAYSKLNIEQVKADLKALMKDSKEAWPADYGHYGPLFIRMAWHSAGTYRAADGRGGSDGGQQRFYPLANWPDNANLDKARALIQPIVDKYYPNLSFADAMILAGDLAMQDMGFQTNGVAGGRADDLEPDLVYWGPEDAFLKSERFDKKGNLSLPLAASVMGLIYVNPEGPDGKPDPLLSAERIRITFGRMGMNDEETVALIAGGHAFGKTHGAPKPAVCIGKAECPEAKGAYTNTSGIEGSWTSNPVTWTHDYLTNLYKYDWQLSKGPGGKFQWFAKNLEKDNMAPDAHDPSKLVPIMMLTTDLALKMDPKYKVISTRYLNNPDEFGQAFADAWFKLIHRDLGPKSRYLGKDYVQKDFLFQDPISAVDYTLVDAADIKSLKKEIMASSLSVSDRIKTAWASAVSFRGSDDRGGANGARICLEPQKSWEANEPQLLARNIAMLRNIQKKFNQAQTQGPKPKKISMADLIVLAGNTGVEEAALKAGSRIEVPFLPGRNDASQEQTEVKSFDFLKVTADGFRNYYNKDQSYLNPSLAFADKADLLNLTPQEMTVLTGGMRVLGANYKDSKNGVFTKTPGTLTNDFFVNLLEKSTVWTESADRPGVYIGRDRSSNAQKWTATSQDLIFGTNASLRLISYSYGTVNAKRKFVTDFAGAWNKVMNLDRFEVNR